MNYKMTVIIRNPETEPGMNSDIVMNLTAEFSSNPDDYGNGYYVGINGEKGFGFLYDLRYNHDFNKEEKEVWLTRWAHHYWNGKNGAYEVKSLTIEKE